jgi:hypothetical protein
MWAAEEASRVLDAVAGVGVGGLLRSACAAGAGAGDDGLYGFLRNQSSKPCSDAFGCAKGTPRHEAEDVCCADWAAGVLGAGGALRATGAVAAAGVGGILRMLSNMS